MPRSRYRNFPVAELPRPLVYVYRETTTAVPSSWQAGWDEDIETLRDLGADVEVYGVGYDVYRYRSGRPRRPRGEMDLMYVLYSLNDLRNGYMRTPFPNAVIIFAVSQAPTRFVTDFHGTFPDTALCITPGISRRRRR